VTPAAPAATPAAASAPAAQAKATTKPAAAAPVAAGGVKGVQVTRTSAGKPKAKGGVLGTTTRLGSTVAGSHLPFTGLPLWIFAAVAAALILLGFALRRSATGRI
jgi:hypothetical protein